MLATVAPSVRLPFRAGIAVGELGALLFGAAVAAGLIIYMGFWALAAVAYGGGIAIALLYPRGSAMVLLTAMMAIEADAIDFTRPVSLALWEFPEGVEGFLPMTATPFDMFLAACAVSLARQPRVRIEGAPGLPLLLFAVPVVLLLGYAYGVWYKGGPSNIAYVEARGLLMGAIAFFVALRMLTVPVRWLHTSVFVGSTALAVIVIARYMMFGQGDGAVAAQFLFDHADVLVLGIGAVYSFALVLRARSDTTRLLLISHQLLMLMATVSTGRRSGTLVLLMAIMVILALMLVRRPMITIWFASGLMVVGSIYLAAYWNQDYGALAQPARAIRSQIDPNANDESSDTYRDIERFNVIQTIKVTSPIFGVGLGNRFAMFRSVPVLRWWPFQFVTPHENILWIWLKFGIAGIGVLLGVWVLALQRCIRAFLEGRKRELPVLPLGVAAGLVMYFAFAQVDIMLVIPRSTVPLAILLAIAFNLPIRDKTPNIFTPAARDANR